MRLGKKIPEDAPDWFWQAVCRLDMHCCSLWSAIFFVRPFVFLTTMMTSSSHAQVSATCMSGHTTHLRCTHWRYRTEECSKGSSDSLDFGTNFLHFHPLSLFPMCPPCMHNGACISNVFFTLAVRSITLGQSKLSVLLFRLIGPVKILKNSFQNVMLNAGPYDYEYGSAGQWCLHQSTLYAVTAPTTDPLSLSLITIW